MSESPEGQASTPGSGGTKSSTGLDSNIAGLLCYLVGFITGIIFLIIEKEDKLVRFHAMQSTIVFGGIFVLTLVLAIIPILGWILDFFLALAALVLWLLLMVMAVQGKRFKLPIIGDIAENQL